MGINEVRAVALALDADERAQLAHELLDSLHPPGMDQEELDAVLAKRLERVAAGTATLHPISSATETLERMLRQRTG